ncbi:MAG: T9SS type A sorting domain-containing protein [Chitinophagaceae bacterium]|nr:T9SS type A sorting domain-containing protein [Chitinophagaceae bacterium]
MKKIITFLILALVSNFIQAQTLVGIGQSYPTLKSAFDDINNGTLTGNIEWQITSSITETTVASLNASGTGFASYSSVAIYPTGAGYTIASTTNTGGLVLLNGADHVTIDGRVNRLGNTPDLTLSYNFPNQPASTVQFQNGARFNHVEYCNINVSSPNGAHGAVKFAGNVDTANANSRNNVNHNNLSFNTPVGGLQLLIMLVNENADTIENNNFIDFMFQYTVPLNGNSSAIRMINGCFNNLVRQNSFYNTANFQPLQSTNTCAIYSQGPVNAAFLPNHIIGNYIGGTAPQCGGSPMTITAVNAADKISFTGIANQGGNLANEVADNVIANISLVNNKQDLVGFYGIYHYSGYSNIHHNTIGSDMGNGSISIQNANNSCDNFGIYISGNSFPYIHHNTIGSVTCTNTSLVYNINFTGIQKSGSGGYVILEKNLIGSNSTPASIQTNSSADGWQALKGIYLTNADSALVLENTISHLYNNCTKTDNANEGGVTGIHNTFTVNARINKNIIRNLSCNSASAGTVVGPVTGIYNASNGNLFQEMTGNMIYNLQGTNASAANILVKGIAINFAFVTAGNYTVSNNLIHSLSTATTGGLSMIEGIAVHNGDISLINNIITLGTTSRRAYGVHQYQSAGSATVHLYHNTIYIGGAASDFESAAYRKANAAPTGNFQNNIFNNNKANASGNQLRHFAFITLSTFGANSINYNNYFAPNTGGAVGRYMGTDNATLAEWQTSTTQDANSIQTDPVFANAGGTQSVDYFPGTPMPAAAIAGINTDLLLNNRTQFWMGALESNVPLPLMLNTFTADLQADNRVNISWSTTAEYNTAYFEVERSTDAKSWLPIAKVAAGGITHTITNYNRVDDELLSGIAYYRLKMTDLDSKFSYSPVEKVSRIASPEFSIFPNPCSMILNIKLPENPQGSVIEIYTFDGKKIMSVQTQQLNHQLNIETLTKGTYTLRVLSNQKATTTKFIKQ